MNSVGHKLRIKYGLENDPGDLEIEAWRRPAEEHIADGQRSEEAGDRAAREIWPDYKTHVFKTEADNIEALLRTLAGK